MRDSQKDASSLNAGLNRFDPDTEADSEGVSPAAAPFSQKQQPQTAPNPDLRVLFVTSRTDAPYRYRCMHPCLQLRQEGIRADVTFLDASTAEKVKGYSLLVLFRLPWSEHLRSTVDEARRRNIRTVFDIDDFIFDPKQVPRLHFWDTVHPGDKRHYLETAQGLAKTFAETDFFIGATAQLAAAARAREKTAFVHRNVLHPSLVRSSLCLRAARKFRAPSPIISYMSGSATHDVDFLLIAPVLRRVLYERPEAFLLVCGFVDLSDYFSDDDPQIIRFPFLDWKVLPWVQALADVNVAPLAVLDPFTHSKSALKFFESAICGVPTIASPTEEMKRAIRHGENGFLAASNQDWHESLHEALNSQTGSSCGRNAFESARTEHSFAATAGALRRIFEDMLDPACRMEKKAPAATSVLPEHVDPAVGVRPGDGVRRIYARTRSILGVVSKYRRPLALRIEDPAASGTKTLHHCFIDVFPEDFLPRPEKQSEIFSLELPTPEVIANSEKSVGWEIAWDISVDGDDYQFRSTSHDPCFLSPALTVDSNAYRFFLLRMKAKSPVPTTFGQIYWLSDACAAYSESRSFSFPVLCDGEEHSYLVDLHRPEYAATTAAPWPGNGMVHRLRFDPLRERGLFEISGFSFLGTEFGTDAALWQSLGLPSLTQELAQRYFRGEGIYLGTPLLDFPLPPTAEIRRRAAIDEELPAAAFDFCVLQVDHEHRPAAEPALAAAARSLRRDGVLLFVHIHDAADPEPALPRLPTGVTVIEQHHLHAASEMQYFAVVKKVSSL
jgi:hypothetical protein